MEQIVSKVPHVHGYRSASMEALIDEMVGVGKRGKEKLWTAHQENHLLM